MDKEDVKKVSSSGELQEFFRNAQEQSKPVALYRKAKAGETALDFSDWNNMEVFDVDNLMAVVPPGMLLKDLNAAAAKKGLRFIPADSPFYSNLSVGEWAYRGCPNPASWKYGAGKHFLLGSTYVLPNGDITSVGGKCIKNVTGYDFTRFLTGAYADLAVGAQYILKLMPMPACRHQYDVTITSLSETSRLIANLQARSVPPAWLFWADEVAGGRLFGQDQKGHRIVFELDGNDAEVNNYRKVVDEIIAAGGYRENSPAAGRMDLSGLESDSAGFWLLDEFKVPFTAIDKFGSGFEKLMSEHGLSGGMFGQLADGKIHVFIAQTQSEVLERFLAALKTEAVSLGGTVSGKYSRLKGNTVDHPMVSLELAFKKKIDPQLIFNRLTEVTQ